VSGLAGHHVIVARAAAQAGRLIEELERRGAKVLAVPTIEVVRRVEAVEEVTAARLRHLRYIVVTSANALDVIGAPANNIAVVGVATAAEARRLGHTVVLVAPDGTAASLVASVPVPTEGDRLLVVQGSAAMPVVTAGLAANGWGVDVVTAYDTHAAPRLDHLMPRMGSASAVVFTSPSTVQNYVAMYGVELVPPVVIAIGPSTAAACSVLGLLVAATAETRSPAGMADACERALT
jgi:uroporphyrinogen-III synthase